MSDVPIFGMSSRLDLESLGSKINDTMEFYDETKRFIATLVYFAQTESMKFLHSMGVTTSQTGVHRLSTLFILMWYPLPYYR